MNLFNFFKSSSPAHNEIAENGADKVLSSEEENPSVHKTYVNFPTSRKSALDVPLYAISSGRSERPKNGADAKPCLSDVYKMSTRAKRRQTDVRLSGRSMVEMLGVLAIIGILSVGAIAGYSKAMMKYKLNKQAEAINLLLNNAIQNTKRFQNNSTSDNPEMYAQIMDKLGLLPDGIELSSSNATYLTDKMFGNSLWIYAYPYQYGMGYEFSRHGDKKEICRNLLNVYKANSSELYYVVSDRYYQPDEGDSSEENYSKSGSYYGDAYCKEGNNCLRSISLNDIDLLCHQCAEDSTQCRFYATWK